ncbi:hypothetical protein ASPSYDRAFT_283018 [Aspergillus sydowii CBS 593.65]|uniref:Uncharacterized protein n=1 Tax=Aspergillus sydowii CBS 593.65 TaxID=1036612 RepID=A0A1L9TX86_9EURO|nr:uncharacterized protein ASPSYDRAFT_283018 [Aspergillus sydowii CBS 593.65]OJJ64015.1 hypothetical protein ASPSYDRAFT_283018 [Aspergillus sydowii CBS 593.65]
MTRRAQKQEERHYRSCHTFNEVSLLQSAHIKRRISSCLYNKCPPVFLLHSAVSFTTSVLGTYITVGIDSSCAYSVRVGKARSRRR